MIYYYNIYIKKLKIPGVEKIINLPQINGGELVQAYSLVHLGHRSAYFPLRRIACFGKIHKLQRPGKGMQGKDWQRIE